MFRVNKITAFLFFLVSVQGLIAQAPKRFYTKFGGNGDDIGYSGKPTLDGQYIIAGSSTSYGSHGLTDVYLLKVDSMGRALWGKFIGGAGNDVAKSVVQLPDSGYILAGYTNSYGAGGYDAFLLRTDKNGEVIWERTFGGVNWDFGADVVVTPTNFIFMVGNTTSFGAGKKDGFVVKYDLNGNFQTQKFFGGVEDDDLAAIIITNDSFLATVGTTKSKSDINGDIYFEKMNLSLDTIFTRIIGGAGKDVGNDLIQKNYDDYIIAGAKTYSSNPKSESLMYSITKTGQFTWENHYYHSKEDEAFVSLTNSFQYEYFTAYLKNVPVPNANFQGNIFLGKHGGYDYKINSFGGVEFEECYSIEGLKDWGYLIVGYTTSFGSVGQDIFFMKHDSTLFNYSTIVSVPRNKNSDEIIAFQSQDNLIVQVDQQVLQIAIFDLTGQKIYEEFSGLNNKRNFAVNVQTLPSGIYILHILDQKGIRLYKKIFIN